MGNKQKEISTIKIGDIVKFNKLGLNHLLPYRVKQNLSSNIQGEIESIFITRPNVVRVIWENGHKDSYNVCYLKVIKSNIKIFIGIKFKNNEIKT